MLLQDCRQRCTPIRQQAAPNAGEQGCTSNVLIHTGYSKSTCVCFKALNAESSRLCKIDFISTIKPNLARDMFDAESPVESMLHVTNEDPSK